MSHRAALPPPEPGPHRGPRAAPVPAAEPGLELAKVAVHRGGKAVLQDISATLPAGAITGLLGPSGSGKTTLLRAILGVQRLRAGRIMVLGRPAGEASLRREVGYVTQGGGVYRDLRVQDNVRYFAALHQRTADDVAAALAAVRLTHLARQRTGELSGGQLSRVALACALVARPRLLLLDEPTVGLDPVLRAELWAQFRTLAAAGVTLLVSSHVMEEAGHCDELLLLREGRLVAQLTPELLRERAGTPDLELAFLRLIRGSTHDAGGGIPA